MELAEHRPLQVVRARERRPESRLGSLMTALGNAAGKGPGGVFIMTAAGEGRLPHSAIDGGPLRQGEFYHNVTASELEGWLSGFAEARITTNPQAGDIYARAVKA